MKLVYQKRYKKRKVYSIVIKTVDTFVTFATNSSSVTLSNTGFGLIVGPISTGTICRLTLAEKSFKQKNNE